MFLNSYINAGSSVWLLKNCFEGSWSKVLRVSPDSRFDSCLGSSWSCHVYSCQL